MRTSTTYGIHREHALDETRTSPGSRASRRALTLIGALLLAVVGTHAVSLTGNGNIAYIRFDLGPAQLWIMEADGGNQRRLIPDAGVFNPAWSPDGTRLAVTIAQPVGTAGPGLYIVSADGTSKVKFASAGFSPAWSADGARLAYSLNGDIWMANVDGSGTPQRLTTDGLQNVYPSWSPDGSQIAYQHQRFYGNATSSVRCCDQIWVVNTDPANPNPRALSDPVATAVTNTIANAYDYYPRWSPDGARILFVTSRADPNQPGVGRVQAWLMDADGSNQRPISTNTFHEYYPAWSPSGTSIVFASTAATPGCDLDCKFDIYTMTATGQNTTRLTFHDGTALYPAWQPIASSGDTTAPTVNCAPPPAILGWTNANVTVTCTATDNPGGSGLANAGDASFSLSTSVPSGTETSGAMTGFRVVCDVANNCAPQVGPYGPFMIDRKAPTITIAAPVDNSAFIIGQPVASSYRCDDGGSGVATCVGTVPSGAAFDTTSVGTKTFTVNATDNVANAAPTLSYTYLVSYGVKLLGTNNTISLRLVDWSGTNLSSGSITLTVTSIDGVGVANQAFTFNRGAMYRYSPSSSLSKGPHVLTFVATGDPVEYEVPFKM